MYLQNFVLFFLNFYILKSQTEKKLLHYHKKEYNTTKIFEKLNNIYKSDVL